jgi:hypothetical protein
VKELGSEYGVVLGSYIGRMAAYGCPELTRAESLQMLFIRYQVCSNGVTVTENKIKIHAFVQPAVPTALYAPRLKLCALPIVSGFEEDALLWGPDLRLSSRGTEKRENKGQWAC